MEYQVRVQPLTVKTGTTPRNSGILELLSYGTWLHRVWCALVVSPVPDLPNKVSEFQRFRDSPEECKA